MAMMSAACAKPLAVLDDTLYEGIVWPGGQEKARIKYLWSINRIKGAERGAVSKALFGSQETSPDPRDSEYLVEPHGVFVDKAGRLYVTDTVARRVSVIDLGSMRSQEISERAGDWVGTPVSVVSAEDGRIYISDGDHARVGIYGAGGDYIGYIEGELQRPTGLAIDGQRGVLYVVDTWAHTIYMYDLEGKRIGSFGGRGKEAGKFNFPVHMAVGGDGRLYVADSLNFRVQIFSPAGEFISEFGSVGGDFAEFDKIKGIAVDTEGHIYVSDAMQDMVKIFDDKGRLLLFFGKRGKYYGDFSQPAGIYIDGDNKIYVSDALNGRVQAFQFLGGQ